MICLTLITIVIASVFICLVKFQQRLNSKEKGLFNIYENIPLTVQPHTMLFGDALSAISPPPMILPLVPPYAKAMSTSVSLYAFQTVCFLAYKIC